MPALIAGSCFSSSKKIKSRQHVTDFASGRKDAKEDPVLRGPDSHGSDTAKKLPENENIFADVSSYVPPPSTLRLIIDEIPTENIAYNSENDSLADLWISFLSYQEQVWNLGVTDSLKLKNRPEKFEICHKNEKGDSECILLPDSMQNQLIRYFTDGKPDGDFDCFSFAHFVLNVPYEFAFFRREKWELTLLAGNDIEDLRYGDSVLISHDESGDPDKLSHFAVYIGKNLFISKFGSAGRLIVTDIENMKKLFGGSKVLLAKYTGESVQASGKSGSVTTLLPPDDSRMVPYGLAQEHN